MFRLSITEVLSNCCGGVHASHASRFLTIIPNTLNTINIVIYINIYEPNSTTIANH